MEETTRVALRTAEAVAVSVIMPFYKRFGEFKAAFTHNCRFFRHPGVELVLVLDEPTQEAVVLEHLRLFPLLRYRVLVNDRDHAWRNPGKAINVGIRHAAGDTVLIISPESLFASDLIAQALRSNASKRNAAQLGRVVFATHQQISGRTVQQTFEQRWRWRPTPGYHNFHYGSLIVRKALLEHVGGYDETLVKWGGDDDNLRVRLAMAGAELVLNFRMCVVHPAATDRVGPEPEVPRHTEGELVELCTPFLPIVNASGWGFDFDRIAADWRTDDDGPPVVETPIEEHLAAGAPATRTLVRSKLKGPTPRLLAVFSFRHDAHLVPDLIRNIESVVDGWVALDDRTSTGLFSDEVERRRLLIRHAASLGAQWVLLMDPDERLEDGARATLDGLLTAPPAPLCWGFNLREMYAPDAYRVDGIWGEKVQWRLFPLLNDLQIGGGALHAPICAGYERRETGLNIYHLKMITRERREARRDLYKRLDPQARLQAIGYDYLANETGLMLETIPEGRGYSPEHREDRALWMAPAPP